MTGRIGGRASFLQKPVFRVGLILLTVLVIFVTIQQLSIPKSFGQYGYFRGDNISEWTSQEGNYASGNQVCEKCHQSVVQGLALGEHGKLDCQSCHGPALKHVKKPAALKLKVEGTAEVCGVCHRKMAGRSGEQIPTVELGIHNGGVACIRCHNPHQPWAQLGGRKN